VSAVRVLRHIQQFPEWGGPDSGALLTWDGSQIVGTTEIDGSWITGSIDAGLLFGTIDGSLIDAIATSQIASFSANVVSAVNGATFSGVNITNLNMGNAASGTLVVGRGGTGATSFTANQIVYGNGTSAITSSSNFTFNSSTKLLTLGGGMQINGTYSGDVGLSLQGSVLATGFGATGINFGPVLRPQAGWYGTACSIAGTIDTTNGTIATGRGIWINALSKSAGNAITNVYSLYLESQTIGATNWGIRQVGSTNTNLFDAKVLTTAGIGVGNSASASALGTLSKKMEVFDASGNSLGFVPIYTTIT
jgi:hypothetical protein